MDIAITTKEALKMSMKKIVELKLIILLTALLSACSANHYSIHHKDQLKSDSSEVIAVDAKQRFLLSSLTTITNETNPGTQGNTKTTEVLRRYCLEPSPDVFSVLSQSASGSGSFGQTADPKSINVALQAAFSSSETGSTISRTQTVNMLKEMMYRTCERYLNGQIGDLEYPIIAARDQRIMSSILAIEQLTGTLQPKPVIIAATGNASTGQSTTDVISSLENAKKDVDEKKDVLTTAQKEFAETDKPEGACQGLWDKKADEIKSDEDKAKLKDCSNKKNNISNADTELKNSRSNYEKIANIATKQGASATSGAQLLYSESHTEVNKELEQVRLQTIQNVADTVKNIVAMSFNQNDETSFFCYRALDPNNKNIHNEVSKSCIQNIAAKVDNETARLKLETQQAMAIDINKVIDKIRALTAEQALAAEKNLDVPTGYVFTKMKDKGIEEKRLTDGEAAKKALETRAIYSDSNNELKKITTAMIDAVQDWAKEINKVVIQIRLLLPEQALTAEKSLGVPKAYVLTKMKDKGIEEKRLINGEDAKKALEIRAIYSDSNDELNKIVTAVSATNK